MIDRQSYLTEEYTMRSLLLAALLLSVASTVSAQTTQTTLRNLPPVVIRPVQTSFSDQLPAPKGEVDLKSINQALFNLNQRIDALTVPTQTSNGVTLVQPTTSCESGECLQIDVVEQAAPTIATEMQTLPPQVQMVPRHVPPPRTHSLMYQFDQSYPQLPIVDVDNDAGCGSNVDHYEIAVICIDGKPTQVLNPEPAKRSCVKVFADNLSNLLHNRDSR
jgi:hypothetical protein